MKPDRHSLSDRHPCLSVVLRACGFLCALAAVAPAATVRTLDGKIYDGEIKLEAGALVVMPRAGSMVRIDAANLLQFIAKSSVQSRRGTQAQLPAPWEAASIGRQVPQATAVFFDGLFNVKGSGAEIGGTFDTFQFVYQTAANQSGISGRIRSVQNLNAGTQAGFMLRKSLDVGSPFVYLYATPDKKLWLMSRAGQGGAAKTVQIGQWDPSLTYRLQHSRKLVISAGFVEGRGSATFGNGVEVDLGDDVLAGMAVCSHDRGQAALGQFNSVAVQGSRVLVGFDAPVVPKGVLFRNGTLLAGSVVAADDTTIKGTFDNVNAKSFSSGRVARIYFRPLTANLLSRIPRVRSSDAHGALLTRGDFMEGELLSVTNTAVTVRSVQFGDNLLPTGTAAAALVLADTLSPTASFTVRAANGSIYMADSIKFEKGTVIVQDQIAGPVNIGEKDVVAIRTIGGRFDSLADIRPATINADQVAGDPAKALVIDGTPAGVSLSLNGVDCDRGLGMSTGASVTYTLGGEYKSFLAFGGVPAELVPMVRLCLIAIADGKEVFRSPELTSVDDAVNISLNLEGVKSLTLRVECASGQALGGCAIWGEPLLVKK